MNILAITDIHGRTQTFQNILESVDQPDLICLGGDLTNFGSVSDAEHIVQMAQKHCDHILAVAGNCDSNDIDNMLSKRGISVHADGKTLDDMGFFGVSAMPIWHNSMYEFTEDEIDVYLKAAYSQVEDVKKTVMISHTPPIDSEVDQTRTGESAGSESVRKWIEKTQPDLVLSGHIHEARGTSQIGSSTIVNCGPAKEGSFATIVYESGQPDVRLHSVSS